MDVSYHSISSTSIYKHYFIKLKPSDYQSLQVHNTDQHQTDAKLINYKKI